MSKIFKVIICVFLGLIIISVSASFFVLSSVSKKLDQPSNYLFDTFRTANQSNPYLGKDKINFIILGLDERNDTLEKTETTDTVIFASLSLKNYKINTISIPRDLWDYDINAKVNEIYPLSLKEKDKFSFIKDKFKKLTNQNIDHVVIVTTDNLIEFTKLIGGVDLVLDQGFKDIKYPNPDYIKNPSPKIPMYTTVEFKAGPIHLDESNITQFVRSRKGGETEAQGGTDLARIHRQQLLLEAILAKVKSGEFITSESQIVDLYKFWNQKLTKDITDTNLIQIYSLLNKNISQISLNKIELPVGQDAKTGVLYHPNTFINKQWVFIPSDKDYHQIQDLINKSIN
jgi:anionic cell wall polymer biosynthesis LytR-Cps2A-Psr (LCP) family protein